MNQNTEAAEVVTTAFERAARWRKVAKLTAVLYVYGIERKAVEHLNPEQWRQVARCAGVNPPSTETVALLVDILKQTIGFER